MKNRLRRCLRGCFSTFACDPWCFIHHFMHDWMFGRFGGELFSSSLAHQWSLSEGRFPSAFRTVDPSAASLHQKMILRYLDIASKLNTLPGLNWAVETRELNSGTAKTVQGFSRFAIHVYNACFDGYPSRRMTSAIDCVASYIASAFSFCSLVYIIPSFPPVQDFVRRAVVSLIFAILFGALQFCSVGLLIIVTICRIWFPICFFE